MNNLVYRKYDFVVFRGRNGYIVYNTKKEFNQGHTHLKQMKSCKDIIEFAQRKVIPEGSSPYFITSLMRISDDEKFINRLEHLKQTGEGSFKKRKQKPVKVQRNNKR